METTFKDYPCHILGSKETYAKYAMAFPFQRDSPYAYLINYQINHVWQAGLKSRMFEKAFLYKELSNCESEDGSFKEITYHNIVTAFMAVGMGVFVAGCSLIIEYWQAKCLKEN